MQFLYENKENVLPYLEWPYLTFIITRLSLLPRMIILYSYNNASFPLQGLYFTFALLADAVTAPDGVSSEKLTKKMLK